MSALWNGLNVKDNALQAGLSQSTPRKMQLSNPDEPRRLRSWGKGPLMLHAPLAGCTVGEGKVGLILEYVDGTLRASTRDLQRSGKLLVSQI